MKFFFYKLFLLSSPFLFLLVYIEYRLQKMPTSYEWQRTHFERDLATHELIILGSSQAYYGINPAILGKGFNLANVSQSLFYDKKLAEKYIEKMPNLKKIILSFSYFSLNYDLIMAENWRIYAYWQYYKIAHRSLKKYHLSAWTKTFLYSPRLAVHFWVKQNFKAVDLPQTNGWLKMDTSANEYINTDIAKMRLALHHRYGWDENIVQENISNLATIMDLATKKNIELIVVTPPVVNDYSQYTNPAQEAKNKHILDSLQKIYHFRYLDFFRDTHFTNSDFNNPDHLNELGAIKFSTLLKSKIQD